jgi:predicted nuclease of predicted toxin-antitoxin system
MRVLLDECLPRRLKRDLAAFEVSTVPEAGLAGLKDGKLLTAMEGRFDCLVTIDGGFPFQQRISGRPFSVVVLRAPSNTYIQLSPLMPALRVLLLQIAPGNVRHLPDVNPGAMEGVPN